MAAEASSAPPVTTTTGGQSTGGGGSGSGAGGVENTSFAEKVAANIAALGYTDSPIAQAERPVIIQAPQGNDMLWILVILAFAIAAFFYLKKRGDL